MEFSEVREYQFGDDIRSIDWNVTSRMGHPYVKKHVEERELTVILLVDFSASGEVGTRPRCRAGGWRAARGRSRASAGAAGVWARWCGWPWGGGARRSQCGVVVAARWRGWW